MESDKPIRKRGVYLLPNLLTSAALFAGFYSIMVSYMQCLEIDQSIFLIQMVYVKGVEIRREYAPTTKVGSSLDLYA